MVGLLIVLIVILVIITYIYMKLQNPVWKAQCLLMFENWGVYLVSFFVPLVGIIVGSINLTKDEPYKKNIGMNCIILGVMSIIIAYLFLK